MDKYFNQLKKEQEIKKHQLKRIDNFIKQNNNIDDIFIKLIKWEKDYDDKLYYKGIDGYSTLFQRIIDYMCEKGKSENFKADNPFLTSVTIYNNIKIEEYQGQGMFYKIYFNNTQIF